MKSTFVLPVVLLATSNIGIAGGLSIDNVHEHMGANEWVVTQGSPSEIVVKGPLDKFNVVIPQQNESAVDQNKFKHSNDKLSSIIKEEKRLLAGDPNFLRKVIHKIA
jgi:catechol-2,3-dioxygenase